MSHEPLPPGVVASEVERVYALPEPTTEQLDQAQHVISLCLRFRNALEDRLGDVPGTYYGQERASVLRMVDRLCEQALLLVLRPSVTLPHAPGGPPVIGDDDPEDPPREGS